jgi:hypothetical protein
MTAMPALNNTKQFAVGAVARHFSVAWRIGAGPPDAYATVSGRRVALDIAIITQPPCASPLSAPRLREDAVARRVLRDIESALRPHVPNPKSIILTLGAPIKVPKKLVAALTTLLLEYFQAGVEEREESKMILGNRVRFRVVKQNLKWNAKVLGFVFSGDPQPADLANASRALHGKIAAMAQRRMPASFTGDRWLILSSDAWIADIKTYRQIYSHLSLAHSFKRILMVFDHGRVETLTES